MGVLSKASLNHSHGAFAQGQKIVLDVAVFVLTYPLHDVVSSQRNPIITMFALTEVSK